jgi:hypothetical protein
VEDVSSWGKSVGNSEGVTVGWLEALVSLIKITEHCTLS